MDATLTTGWWTCSDCGVDAELSGADTARFRIACPDCDGVMAEQWRWDGPAISRPLTAAPLTRAA